MPPVKEPVFLQLQNSTYLQLESIPCDEHSEILFVQNVESGKKYVVKIMDCHRSLDYFREIRILERLQGHQNIIRLLDKETRANKYYMVLEMGGIDLADFIQRYGTLDEDSAKEMFVQMLDALAQCHSNRVCHHDIKLENFLFDETTHAVKLIDFGFSVDLSTSSLIVPTSSYSSPSMVTPNSGIIAGRYDWCSPLYASKQVLHQEDHQFEKTDIFGLGICLFYMLCGRFPFCSEDDEFETLRTNIRTMEIDQILQEETFQSSGSAYLKLSEFAKDLLKKMLVRIESDRCDLNDIYNHPWLYSANVEYMSF